MANIELSADAPTVHLRGWDAVWALRRRIDVPLSRVRGARHDPAAARAPRGLRAPGTYLPRVVTAWARSGVDAVGTSGRYAIPPRRSSSTSRTAVRMRA